MRNGALALNMPSVPRAQSHLGRKVPIYSMNCCLAQGGGNATLQDVCYKAFAGGECVTQSLLQYWQMDRRTYEKGDAATRARLSPDYCIGHWSTACRGAYGGPQVCSALVPRCSTDCIRAQ